MPGSILKQNLRSQNNSLRTCDEYNIIVHGEAVTYFGMAISKSTSAVQLPGKLQLTNLYLPIYKLKRRRFPGCRFDYIKI
jgi:hypothetical protein